MPVTSLSLPLVSHGGCTLLACRLALGLVSDADLTGLYEPPFR